MTVAAGAISGCPIYRKQHKEQQQQQQHQQQQQQHQQQQHPKLK